MSVATQLFAPGYDPEYDPKFDPEYDPEFASGSEVSRGAAPGRRAHLRAVGAPGAPGALPLRTLSPVVAPARRAEGSVAVLLAPEPERVPVKLTRRGVVVLGLLVAAVGAALVWVAALSAPSDAASGGAGSAGSAPAVVTVEAGDTLWSIAGRVAPNTDPRAEVEHLRRLNHLGDVALVPGQQLHVR